MAKASSKSFSLSKSHHFLLFWFLLCTTIPDISSSSENINNTAGVSRLSFRSKQSPGGELLKNSQNSQKNTPRKKPVLESLSNKVIDLKKRLTNSCFPVSFAKFVWTPFCRTSTNIPIIWHYIHKKPLLSKKKKPQKSLR